MWKYWIYFLCNFRILYVPKILDFQAVVVLPIYEVNLGIPVVYIYILTWVPSVTPMTCFSEENL